ncbi:MAG: D-2-hydroxyacid dehydrogenase [Anaerolineaceae bacterium]|jgi:phosphoglycerate dehydrogenase-like enzyme|nr:D-2-hydroxyacid dehydrogenase [Anaerolineaceae bacterium]
MTGSETIEVLITVPYPEDILEELRAVSPRLNITVRKPENVTADMWKRVEVLYAARELPEVDKVPALKWYQSHFVGIESERGAGILEKPGLIVTTMSGAAAPQVAEYIVAMMLALGHRLPDLMANQRDKGWPDRRWERFEPLELRGSTVGILGYGSIGREVSRVLQPFDVSILAAKRDVMHPEDHSFRLEGIGDPEGQYFTRLYPIEARRSMMQECDFVVSVLPGTPDTMGLIGAAELAAMKPTAMLVDAGRGGVIDPDALYTALTEKKLAGAVLDVFVKEPLPPESPFWSLPNVIITPHVAWTSPAYRQRAAKLFAANLHRYVNGEPLYNQFDPEKGY